MIADFDARLEGTVVEEGVGGVEDVSTQTAMEPVRSAIPDCSGKTIAVCGNGVSIKDLVAEASHAGRLTAKRKSELVQDKS